MLFYLKLILYPLFTICTMKKKVIFLNIKQMFITDFYYILFHSRAIEVLKLIEINRNFYNL